MAVMSVFYHYGAIFETTFCSLSLSFSLDGRRARSHKHAYKKEEKKKIKRARENKCGAGKPAYMDGLAIISAS